MDCSTSGIPNHQLPELAQTHVHPVMPSNCLILCHPLLLPSIFPSFRVFSSESILRIKWSKYWSFSFLVRTLILDLQMVKVWRVSFVCLEACFFFFFFFWFSLFSLTNLLKTKEYWNFSYYVKSSYSPVSCPCYRQVLDLLNGKVLLKGKLIWYTF